MRGGVWCGRGGGGHVARALADRWGWPGALCTLQPEASPSPSPSGPGALSRPHPALAARVVQRRRCGPRRIWAFRGGRLLANKIFGAFHVFYSFIREKKGGDDPFTVTHRVCTSLYVVLHEIVSCFS